jgi:hypothetical protein
MIGPSHHTLYGSLHRRRIWLKHLTRAFGPFAAPAWHEGRERLDSSYARTLTRLSPGNELGLQQQLELDRIVDDTPIDSFLATLSDELDAYESNFFDLMKRHGAAAGWELELEETSMLWGRELAQESRMAIARAGARPEAQPGPGRNSLKRVGSLLASVFAQPLLFRRRTDREVSYELRACPHRRPSVSAESTDLACRLDSLVRRGFAQALYDDVRFRRITRPDHCTDELSLER